MADSTLSRARDAIEPAQRWPLRATDPFPDTIDVARSGARKTSAIGTPTTGVQTLRDPRSNGLIAWYEIIQQAVRRNQIKDDLRRNLTSMPVES